MFPSNPCDGLPVCDDFESSTLGQPPRASLWSIGAPDCGPQRGTAMVDSTRAHSGSHSVKVVNDFGANATPPGYCDHVFFNNTSALAQPASPQVYARFYVYLGGAVDPTSHVTLATLTDAFNGGDQLRIGFAGDAFVWNRKSDDAYLPELDTGNSMINQQASQPPAMGSWLCFEFHIDQSAGTIDTWINGAEVPGLVESGMPTMDVSTVWLSGAHAMWKPQIQSVGFGWETYNNKATDAMTLWFDDVAIGSRRIGCLPN
jgi:hypothetical protein